MKIQLALLLTFLLTSNTFADTGTLEDIDISSDQVGITFEDNNKTIVLRFENIILEPSNCVIDIDSIKYLEYKTRVMRYFGGLLVNETHQFKNLIVIIDGKRTHYDWSRKNVSTIVNKMCRQSELLS